MMQIWPQNPHTSSKNQNYIQIDDDDDDDDDDELIDWVFKNPAREYFVHMETLTQRTMHILSSVPVKRPYIFFLTMSSYLNGR